MVKTGGTASSDVNCQEQTVNIFATDLRNMSDLEETDANSELIKAIKSLERTIQQKCQQLTKLQSTAHLKRKDSSLRSLNVKNVSEPPEDRRKNFKEQR